MKVAVLFTGFLRQKEQTKQNFETLLLAPFEADVFVATWDIHDIARPLHNRTEELRIEAEVAGSDIRNFFAPRLRDYLVLSYDLFRQSTPTINEIDRPNDLLKTNQRAASHGTVWMNRLYSQCYMVRRGLQMIREYEERTGIRYDAIARTRTDMLFMSPFPEPQLDKLMYPSTYHDGKPVPQGCVADHFYWGGRDTMMKLEDLCFNIETMYRRQNVDTTYAEILFHSYALKQDIYLQPFDIAYRRA
ncbi:hypothetical protein [Neorhizobium alkalisoli]|uniref:Uncharacterized protein n=1 Tax=Neorhizobium alkalisoli TaxID=528178 RepID=A0A561QX85_9HYPH|nr:hypothetical protein [Neorhizobium alkalisoli]TWF54984.1 hypothetical protein FHW37_103857 [Neorhizobium alkalisoli]